MTAEMPCFHDIQSLYAVPKNKDQTDTLEPAGLQTVRLVGG
jgi:hypothetical protein